MDEKSRLSIPSKNSKISRHQTKYITSSTVKSSPSDSFQCNFWYPDIYKQYCQEL